MGGEDEVEVGIDGGGGGGLRRPRLCSLCRTRAGGTRMAAAVSVMWILLSSSWALQLDLNSVTSSKNDSTIGLVAKSRVIESS